MRAYYAIIHKDEDSAFGATFPDVPGCFAAADQLQHITLEARDALALWFEDHDQPAPSSLEEIIDKHAVDIATSAFVLPIIFRPARLLPAARAAK